MKIKNEKEALQMFCEKEALWAKHTAPFYYSDLCDKLIALNGHILIEVDSNLVRGKYKTIQVSERIENVMNQKYNVNKTIPFENLDKVFDKMMFIKNSEEDKGKICPVCNGEGRVDWRYRNYTKQDPCPMCDGTGELHTAETKKRWQHPYRRSIIDLYGVWFEQGLMMRVVKALRLMGFESMVWRHKEKEKGNIFEVCEGVRVLIMPISKRNSFEDGMITETIKY